MNFVDKTQKNCQFCQSGMEKIASFIDQCAEKLKVSLISGEKSHKFCQYITRKIVNFISLLMGKELQISSASLSIINFVDEARKNCKVH